MLDLKIKRTPIEVGEDCFIYLDLEDIAVIERAEFAYKRLNYIITETSSFPENATEDEKMTFVADIIRKANEYAKQAIDEVFDENIAAKIWGNSSCITFGDSPDNSRFGRAMAALLELYKPAIEKMTKQVEETSDNFANEVLNEGDSIN